MDDFWMHSLLALFVIVIIVFCSSVSFAATVIPEVPKGHPRVYVRADDLPAVRNKIQMDEFADAWERIRSSDQPVCKAFVYLVTGDEAVGRDAVREGLENLQSGHDGRPFFNHMHKAACIYDWCYDVLSEQDKADYIAAFKTFAALDHNRGYPPDPKKAKSVTGHDCEGFVMTNMMPSGLAIYDEDPEMYEASARIFFDQHVPACNYYYQAHMHHQGTHYNGERFVHDIATAWMFRKMGAGDIFSADQQYVLYQLLYHLRPDGQFIKMGDDNDGPGNSLHKRLPARLAGMYYNDPYLLAFSECKAFSMSQRDFYDIFDLLFLEANAPRAVFDDLPRTKYFDFPMGTMVARTGWDMGVEGKTAVVQMHIGQMYYSNHHHLDYGTFQIYYRGLLAMDTGVYQAGDDSRYGSEHWREYYQQTLAHNGLMIFAPKTMAEDFGGQSAIRRETRTLADLQREHRHLGQVMGRAFGPDEKAPTYSYLAGDITQAYGEKAEKVTRSMVTLNTRDEKYPCFFVVYDQMVSTQADFKKAWYLHAQQEPMIDGTQTTLVNTGDAYYGGQYGGKLVVETLLPLDVRIDKVGGEGRECWNEVTQQNYMVDMSTSRAHGDELGAWRIEVVPTAEDAKHDFLHVLTAMDVGTDAPEVEKLMLKNLVGAKVGDDVVLFNTQDDLLAEAKIDLSEECSVLVCGVKAGDWSVVDAQGVEKVYTVDEERGCFYFEGQRGMTQIACRP